MRLPLITVFGPPESPTNTFAPPLPAITLRSAGARSADDDTRGALDFHAVVLRPGSELPVGSVPRKFPAMMEPVAPTPTAIPAFGHAIDREPADRRRRHGEDAAVLAEAQVLPVNLDKDDGVRALVRARWCSPRRRAASSRRSSTASVRFGSGVTGVIVCTPLPTMLNWIVSAPGLAFASRIAWRSDPAPESAVVVTV